MVTFVTALIDLGEDRSKDKHISTYIHLFDSLVSTGIHVHVFASEKYASLLQRPNVHVEVLELNQTNIWADTQGIEYRLPSTRTSYHDTSAFLTLMNAKTEFVSRAMDANVFGSDQYAWIDFGIFHMIRDARAAARRLACIGHSKLRPGVWIPGCWDACTPSFDYVHWRFCGSFFIGDRASLGDFAGRMRTRFQTILQEGILSWEVNVWARLESEGWTPRWFKADHNDSILNLPGSAFSIVASLTTIPPREAECRAAIDSLLHQVDHVYVAVSHTYRRFGEYVPPEYLTQEPYASKVTLCFGDDHGPASKYIGTTPPDDAWVFVCDDDQEYAPDLIDRMRRSVAVVGIYQNHYQSIQQKTSGGMVHGYVGNLVHSSVLKGLRTFPLPECARFVDDQWVSMYCKLNNVLVMPTEAETYAEIFKVTQNGHEKLGTHSLSGLGTRADRVRELEEYFGVSFLDKKA